MNEHLIKKFLAGTATAEEAETVLDWFGTDEGQIWLSDRFDQDVRATWRTMDVLADLDPVVSGREPENSYKKRIHHTIRNELGNEELLMLKLTADFSERPLDNVLETIAHSLGIEVERDGYKVTWKATDRK